MQVLLLSMSLKYVVVSTEVRPCILENDYHIVRLQSFLLFIFRVTEFLNSLCGFWKGLVQFLQPLLQVLGILDEVIVLLMRHFSRHFNESMGYPKKSPQKKENAK